MRARPCRHDTRGETAASPAWALHMRRLASRLPSPVDEAGVGSEGARIAGAGRPLADGEQRGELVAGTSRVSRLRRGRTRRGRRFAVPVRWRAAPLRRTPAGPRAGTRRPAGRTPGTGIGVVVSVPGVTWDLDGDDVRGYILTLAGAEGSTKDPGADAGAACQRGSSGPTHSRSYFAACPARMWMTMTSQLAHDGGCLVAPDADQAGEFCLGQSMLDTRGIPLSRSSARRAGHRLLRLHPGRARAGTTRRLGTVGCE